MTRSCAASTGLKPGTIRRRWGSRTTQRRPPCRNKEPPPPGGIHGHGLPNCRAAKSEPGVSDSQNRPTGIAGTPCSPPYTAQCDAMRPLYVLPDFLSGVVAVVDDSHAGHESAARSASHKSRGPWARRLWPVKRASEAA